MADRNAPPSPLILVVDDNEANRGLARHTLEDEGYRVLLASGGAQGIAAFEQHLPDCIVLDVRMPDIDGFAVCQRIRADPRGASTPVLFLTALRDVETFDAALRAGGDDFLTKPVRPTELVVRVQTALKVRRLGAELHEHYALLKQQRDDLVRVQLQKERLMAFVVHDLKNPVGAMDLQAQILMRERGLPEHVKHAAEQIHTGARQLNRMILNLLDLSKGDEGKLVARPSAVDLAALFASVVADLEPTAAVRGVTIETTVAVARLNADEDLLHRTVANLLENAVRHAPAGSRVHLTGTPCPEGTEIGVRDEGSGVPEALREKIFDPFLQLEGDDRTRSRGGRGLGLAFCKLAVEAHGGRIWVEDGAPGALFRVRLPHAR